jgi:sigma-B regulation protein RsbU (phosphoserine phosphatase)
MEEKVLELRVPAKAERLTLVRAVVRQAAQTAGCNDGLSSKLVIAVNEACMNVIQHAYGGDETGEMVLEIYQDRGSYIRFRLVDYAKPVDLTKIKSRDLNDIRPGGLGVHFISEIMDGFEIGHLEGGKGNFLEMKKSID